MALLNNITLSDDRQSLLGVHKSRYFYGQTPTSLSIVGVHLCPFLKYLWKCQVLLKVCIFIWLAIHDKTLSVINLWV